MVMWRKCTGHTLAQTKANSKQVVFKLHTVIAFQVPDKNMNAELAWAIFFYFTEMSTYLMVADGL